MKTKQSTLFSTFAIAFLDNFGLSLVFIMFAPLILEPKYGFYSNNIAEGTKNLLLGLAIGTFPLLTFFGAPLWGDVADRFGRKQAFFITILGTFFGHFLSALAIFAKSFWFLILARAIAGFFSGNISICLAAISDLSSNASAKAKNLGIWTVVMGLGWILAMLMGGYLSDPSLTKFFTPSLPFGIAALLSLVGYWIIWKFFLELRRPKHRVRFSLAQSIKEIKNAIHYKSIRPYLFTILFWSMGWFFTFQWFTAVSLEQFHTSQEITSLYLVVLGLIWMLGGLVLNPWLVKKFTSFLIAISATLFTALFICLASLMHNYHFFAASVWIATIAAPIGLSNTLQLVSQSAPASIQGRAMGFTQSFQALAGIIVPLAGGVLAKTSISLIFPLGSILLFIASIFLRFSLKGRFVSK